ncbi:MAG: DUF1844 domain-containing protein [Planctomycetes bacterium]|nr:DUF1844 domain-containing protein [Planctomycetota bacterium]
MERADDEQADEGGPETRFDPASFVGLAIGLATQAQVFLGVIENPMTHQKEKLDLPRAKNMVDLLGMLQKKTDGNLTAEESEFLKRLLADLRMRYVQALSGGAPPSA